MTASANTTQYSWIPRMSCQIKTESPKDAPSDSATVPTITSAATKLRVMADESVVTIDDARAIIRAEAADILNVRIGKCGGVLASKQIADEAQRANLELNLGTLVGETGILTRAAEIFGRAVGGFECLDGKGQNISLLAEDVLADPRAAQDAAPDAPGLGIEVSRERIIAHALRSTIF